MPDHALAISQKDLRPLVDDPTSMDGAMDAVERATIEYHRGQVREQNLVDQTQGAAATNLLQIHMAAADGFATGFQLFAEERGGPERPNSRFVAVLDPQTRQLLALVDYWILSPLRVGASAGVGARYLAPPGAKTAGILGSSKQARGQLQAIRRAVPSLQVVKVFSPNAEHREVFATRMSEWLGLSVRAVGSAQEATEGADVLGLANNSRQPTFEMAWVKPGALIATIGGAQQLPPDIAEKTRAVAPNPETVLAREPYASRLQAGETAESLVTALGAVVLEESPVRQKPEDIVLFEVGRLNIWAVAVARFAYEWAAQQGVGTPFSLGTE